MSRTHPEPDANVLQTLNTADRWRGLTRLILILMLGGGGFGVYQAVDRFYRPKPVSYRTQRVQRGDLTITVTATGTLEPTNTVDIGCEISGTIEYVKVDFNDPVSVGDLLITLDTEELEAQVAKSQASLRMVQADQKQAEATLQESRQTLRRIQKLRQRQSVPEQDLETAVANFARAEAQVASSQAQILVWQATLDGDLSKLQKSRIYSPIDGIVLTRTVEPGQTVAATFQTPVLLTLAEDLRQLELQVDIDEADVGAVQDGQLATFSVDAYPDEDFPAKVISLRFAPRRVQDVVTYEAVLEVTNESLKLRPGMTAVAEIVTAKAQDVLLIPNPALRFTPEGEVSSDAEVDVVTLEKAPASQVWVLKEGEPQAVAVKTGRTDGRLTEVVDGELTVGMELLVDVTP